MTRLAGKAAIITGSARGLGAAQARLFAREGAKVLLADVVDAEGQAVAEEIRKAGGMAEYRAHDVTSEAIWAATVDAAVSLFGTVDILVNNAGLSGTSGADLMGVAAFDRLHAVNARGVFLGMRQVLPIMQAK